MSHPSRLEMLTAAVSVNDTVLDAWRAWSGISIAETADRIQAGRTTVTQCLSNVRAYTACRRSLEVEFGLPCGSLDGILDRRDDGET